MPSNLIDNSAEEKKQKRNDRRRERQLSDIRHVLKTPEGRRFYWRLMEEGRVFVDPFCFEQTNNTHYQLGRQSVSRTFLNDLLEAKPEALQQMQLERKSEEEKDKAQDELDEKLNGGRV